MPVSPPSEVHLPASPLQERETFRSKERRSVQEIFELGREWQKNVHALLGLLEELFRNSVR
jgi:hypothetical protein